MNAMATTVHHNELMIDLDKNAQFFVCVVWELSHRGFPEVRPGPLVGKRQIGKIRREPNNRPGCYTAVTYCLCPWAQFGGEHGGRIPHLLDGGM